jgi:hypothetical protein
MSDSLRDGKYKYSPDIVDDAEELTPMSKEETASFMRDYIDAVSFQIDAEIESNRMEAVSLRHRIKNSWEFLGKLEGGTQSQSSDTARDINRIFIEKEIIISEEALKTIAKRIRRLRNWKKTILDPEFLRNAIEGLLKDKFYRFKLRRTPPDDYDLIGWTQLIEVEHLNRKDGEVIDSHKHILGHFRVELCFLTKASPSFISIRNLDFLASCANPHPHISTEFKPCWGAYQDAVLFFLLQKRFISVMQLIHHFLSSYSPNLPSTPATQGFRPYAQARLEHWPRKDGLLCEFEKGRQPYEI